MRWLRIDRQYAGIIVALCVLWGVLAATAPNFATSRNTVNMLQQDSFIGIVALAMTLVIIAAEIDISVGSTMALASTLLAVLTAEDGWPIWPSVLAVVVMGCCVGACAGWVRDQFNVPSFIVTLALLGALEGMAQAITSASPIALPVAGSFSFLGDGSLGGIPFPLVAFAIVFIGLWFVAEHTTFGRSVYAVGGNPEAARMAGLSLRRVRMLVFVGTGGLAAVSGVLTSSLIGSGTSTIGSTAEFQAIAAVIVGGTSLYGGRGKMMGTLFGVLFIGELSDGLILLGANQYLQEIAQGGLILAAVLVNEGLRSKVALARRKLPSSISGRPAVGQQDTDPEGAPVGAGR